MWRTVGLWFLLLISGCNTMNASTTTMHNGDSAYSEGQFAVAEQAYRQALQDDPDNVRAQEMLATIALWRNDLTAAQAGFESAWQRRSWWGRRWPLRTPARMHQAIAAARAGQIQQAAVLLEQAAGPLAVGPFKELKLRARQLALFEDGHFMQVAGAAVAELPFVIRDPLPVIKVVVNGHAPVNFVIDTGGEGVTLDRDYATRVGAQIIGELPGEYAGGKQGMTGFGKVESVQLGAVTLGQLPVTTLDLQSINDKVFKDTEIKGIIGTGIFTRFLATIDYPGQRLILRIPPGDIQQVDRALHLKSTDYSFPLWLVETHLMFVEGSVNDLTPGLMLIDTGLADAGFLGSKAVMAEAGIPLDWSKAQEGAGGGGLVKGLNVDIGKVALGTGDHAIQLSHIRGVVTEQDNSLFTGALGFRVAGLVSHQFFLNFVLSFDLYNGRLLLQQP